MTKKETWKIDEVISELRDEADAFARRIQPVYALLDWK